MHRLKSSVLEGRRDDSPGQSEAAAGGSNQEQ
jgi:hypothetical protein